MPCLDEESQLTDAVAPLMPDVDIEYEIVQFNGSLLKENVYRQNAGPEVDSAWEALGVDCSSHFFFPLSFPLNSTLANIIFQKIEQQ
jgi:hypothetical protein